MKKLILILMVSALFAAPAMADIFGFSVGSLNNSFDGNDTFTAVNQTASVGSLSSTLDGVTTTAGFFNWDTPEAFIISMAISDITSTSAYGIGMFQFTDVDGDYISGAIEGNWRNDNGVAKFDSTSAGTSFTSVSNTTFDGAFGDSVSMVYPYDQPWSTYVVEITASGTWFDNTNGYDDLIGGSIDVTVVPVPGAVLLGMLGLGIVGKKMRKLA